MKNLVFFVEEPSAEALLEVLLRRLIVQENIFIRYVVFEGKQDLEKKISKKVAGMETSKFEIFYIARPGFG